MYPLKLTSALFDFGLNFKKGADFLSSFQKVIICELAGIFEAQKPQESRFFIFKKGAGCQPPIPGRSPVSGRTAFLFSMNKLPRLKKGAGGNGGKS